MGEEEFKPRTTKLQKFLFFAGVIMPVISISIEATTGICAEFFFDPIPTVWHLLVVVFVPLAHLHVWFVIRRGSPRSLRLTGFLNAAAIGVSLFYSIIYLPLLPMATLALVFIIGLLPFAPYLSLFAGFAMRRQLNRITPKVDFNRPFTKFGLVGGLIIGISTIGLIELPASITRYGLQMAASNSPEKQAEGIQFLRSYGNREYLLLACYHHSPWATDLFGFLLSLNNPAPTAEARKIYYRVTGKTFDALPPPQRLRRTWVVQNGLNFDSDEGGDTVGRTLDGLSLTSSRLDASADADGVVGYIEWTLTFLNDSHWQREARAEIQLPPGGVVSRLTLWVNGEEREAAFAARSKVSQAYEQVVRQKRDPVLVTTAGRDRILVQCFPVPPNHGAMKIRLGITVPLVLDDPLHARLLFPHFLDRNFSIPAEVNHLFWIESKSRMVSRSNTFAAASTSPNTFALRGALNEGELSEATSIRLDRSGRTVSWAKNHFESEGFIVRQSIEESAPTPFQRIVIALDTSAQVRDLVTEVEAALRTLPPQFDVNLVLAGDGPYVYDKNSPHLPTFSGIAGSSSALRATKFAGGADNTPALLTAWDLAASKPGINAIVWIHAPQKLQIQPVEELKQRWERRPYGPLLYSVQTRAGADEIVKALDGIDEVKLVPRMGSLREDLEKLFAELTNQVKTLKVVRTNKKEKPPHRSEGIETSAHLARLWASDEVARILTARDESLQEAATSLAARYQLVTPVSGAVVLETAAQYDAAGLKPVDAGTVPTIPEPEMVLLIAIMTLLLCFLVYRHRRSIHT